MAQQSRLRNAPTPKISPSAAGRRACGATGGFSARSRAARYFAAMLRFAWEQGRGGAIDYAAAAPAVAGQLLAYVYAGPDAVALDDPAETMALLVAADEARVANLVRLCERSLAARIGGDAGNARAVLEFCDHYASADGKLRAAALHVLE